MSESNPQPSTSNYGPNQEMASSKNVKKSHEQEEECGKRRSTEGGLNAKVKLLELQTRQLRRKREEIAKKLAEIVKVRAQPYEQSQGPSRYCL